MDGKFVNNKAFIMSEIEKLNDISLKPLDVHLMVKNPEKYIKSLAMLNVFCITFHYETVKDINHLIEYIKSFGLRVGIAINPETNIDCLIPYLNNIDQILLILIAVRTERTNHPRCDRRRSFSSEAPLLDPYYKRIWRILVIGEPYEPCVRAP